MPRAIKGAARRRQKRRLFKKVKGYRGGRSRLYRTAKESLRRSMAYAYRDRKRRKTDFHRLWITRINAAARQRDMTYSRFMEGLKKASVALDRKMLAEIAVNDPPAFDELVAVAKQHTTAQPASASA